MLTIGDGAASRKRQVAGAHFQVIDTSKGYGGPREKEEESSASKRFKDVGPEAELRRMAAAAEGQASGARGDDKKKKKKKKKKDKQSAPQMVLSFDPEEE